ncbi:MAG: 3-oxoacid CoA-transferase subunit B [Candidatus Cloacimonetes bacterium]|nr:3-oxoacid CoA-transferase subunit B [Candidatus Cloacimonadota bacterium]
MSDALKKERIARRIAKELRDGYFVNLGIGIPTMVANYIPEGISVILQSENGLLGIGPYPLPGEEHCDLINAGKETVTAIAGASFFSSSDSFAMIRGGHINATILGAMEVSETGDIANYLIPGKLVKGMGGAMDLVAASNNVIVAMMHTDKHGNSKVLPKCSLPLTGTSCVKKIVSDIAVMDVTDEGLLLLETAEGVSIDDVIKATAAKLKVADNCQESAF